MPLVRNNEALVDEQVLAGVPLEQNEELLREYGFTDEDRGPTRIDIETTTPALSLASYEQDRGPSDPQFADHVQQRMGWVRLADSAVPECGSLPEGSTYTQVIHHDTGAIESIFQCSKDAAHAGSGTAWVLNEVRYL